MNNIDKKMLESAKIALDKQFLHKTFYFKKGTEPKYCILMEKPGKYINNEEAELNNLISNDNHIESYLNFYIRYLIKWILLDNGRKPFFKPFFELILQKKLDTNLNERFLNNEIFNDFYFSDIIKYRSKYFKDRSINVNKNLLTKSVVSFREEISILSNIQLIFIFGNVAFKNLIKDNIINIVKDKNNIIDTNRSNMISELHGSLHIWKFSETREIYVIPLIHMSPRSFNVTIRDTYFEYLKKGLTKYREMVNMKKYLLKV